MDELKKKQIRFRVIKTYPTEDCMATYEYEGIIQELCIELEKYLGNRLINNRRTMEKWLFRYEEAHPNVHFQVRNMKSKRWKLEHRNDKVISLAERRY